MISFNVSKILMTLQNTSQKKLPKFKTISSHIGSTSTKSQFLTYIFQLNLIKLYIL